MGWPYLAVSAWTAQEEARAAAAAIRGEGRRARVTRDPCPGRAGCQWMWVAWASLDDPAVEMEERPAPRPRSRPRRPEGPPSPRARLPDDILIRADGGPRTYHYEGRTYIAVSAWSSQDEARLAAASIRAEGSWARVVPSTRRVVSMPPIDRLPPRIEVFMGRPQRRHTKTKNRWMWLVFTAAPPIMEIAAHAGGESEAPGQRLPEGGST